ncbi:30S ribosomal protein S6--L-glutamate ligase [Crocosphaera sp.]|uniref:30S ribosomal protein S6--L-glutamate ligase n=1 Tax=Crocosphaera sp. TaxID=2729996 RepID=UPI00262250FD|nr:30S ribosomal protein S6--L-glutamate ligase [Crocosphaera sp.]MDJ0582059.1 30S ribosomal protein S6--L-glutamate ligase [Crocosphaera sp.]
MKIAILSYDTTLYSTKRLKETGEELGHDMRVVNYLSCYMNITSHKPSIYYNGKPLESFDAIIPRIGVAKSFYGTAIVRQFEVMGVFCANESQAISRSRDKLRCLQILARDGIALPITGFAHDAEDIDGLLEFVGGVPVVIKLLEGTQGIGVVLAETRNAAKSVIEAFRQLDANILVQEFIQEAVGVDLRCFVVGSTVVAAMKRQGAEGDFRANLHQGGKADMVELTPEEQKIAVKAAKSMGLNVAGVDMLRSNHGPVVIEVNSSPGLEGIEKASGIDVAKKIIEFLAKNALSGNK